MGDHVWNQITGNRMNEDSQVLQGFVIGGFILAFILVIFYICRKYLNNFQTEREVIRPVHGRLPGPYGLGQQPVTEPVIYSYIPNNGAIANCNHCGRNCIPVQAQLPDYLPPPRSINMSDISRDNDPPPPYVPDSTVPPCSQPTAPPCSPDSKGGGTNLEIV